MKAPLRRTLLAACLVLCSAPILLAATPITVYPNPIQFGTVPLNSPSYALYVYVENATSTAVNITGITISGTYAGDFTIVTPACVGTIPANSYCQMDMTFTPSAMGAISANLLIAVSGVTSPETFTLEGTGGNPIPTITSISPDNIYANSPTTTVTVNGSGFLSSSSASIQSPPNNLPVLTTYVSSTQLKVQIPASFLTQAETQYLNVTNPAPAGRHGLGHFPDLSSRS
jgi:hypothetical protein